MHGAGPRLFIEVSLVVAALAGLAVLSLRDAPDVGVEVTALDLPPDIDSWSPMSRARSPGRAW